jgi:hypothetical protein
VLCLLTTAQNLLSVVTQMLKLGGGALDSLLIPLSCYQPGHRSPLLLPPRSRLQSSIVIRLDLLRTGYYPDSGFIE